MGDSIGPLLKILAVAIVVGMLVILFYHVATVTHDHQVTYDTYLSITLTALAILLTVVGILIAVLAIWGYKAIREEARAAASSAAETAINFHLNPEKIEATVRTMVQSGIKSQNDVVAVEGTPGKLTERYPTKGAKGGKT